MRHDMTVFGTVIFDSDIFNFPSMSSPYCKVLDLL